MESRIEVSWTCQPCEVEGQDSQEYVGAFPSCWNCGGPVVVTARPTGCRRPGCGQDVTAHCPRSARIGPAAEGRTSKSKIAVGR